MVVTLDEDINDSLFLYNPDMIIITDLNYNIAKINPSAKKRFANDNQIDLFQTPIFNYIASQDIEPFIHQFQKAIHGELSQLIMNFVINDQVIFHTRTKFIPKFEYETIQGVYLVLDDLHSQHSDYTQLKENENLYRTMAENSLDIITIRDLEGNYLYASPVITRILGYTPEEFVGTNRKAYINSNEAEECYATPFDNNSICTFSYQFRRKDGKYVWLESTTKLLTDSSSNLRFGYLTIARDITERKKSEQLIKNKNARYKTLIEEAPFASIIFQKGKWVYINDAVVQLLGGKNKEEIMNRNSFDFFHPDDHDLIRVRRKLILKGKTISLENQRLIRLDGKPIEIKLKGIPTIFNGKPAVHYVVIEMADQQRFYEMAKNNEKLSLIGQLAAGLAHEIRNPLTSIKGFLQLIEAGMIEKNYFEIIQSEFDRIELIVNELLFVARPQSTLFEKHLFQKIISHLITLIQPQTVLHNIELIVNSSDFQDPIWLMCDINQIKQLLLNLFKNSIEAMPNGGQILLEYSVDSICATIKIIDQGVGIPEELIDKIGQPFFTTKEKGSGLGMMISKQIVKNHNGTLEIESKEGQGTTFIIRLPLDGHYPIQQLNQLNK